MLQGCCCTMCMLLRSWETHRYHGEDQMARRRKLRPAPTSTSISFVLATNPDRETLVKISVQLVLVFQDIPWFNFSNFIEWKLGSEIFLLLLQEKTSSVVCRAEIHTFGQNM